MNILIYNSLTKTKVPLLPIANTNLINWYTCGPTVYDNTHIGHARTYLSIDLMKRIIESKGIKVRMLMGITDIDDKIIEKANLRGENHLTLSRRYETEFMNSLALLKISFPTKFMRVTDGIEKIQHLISSLLVKGLAYQDVNTGDVCFNSKKYLLKEKYPIFVPALNVQNSPPPDFTLWKSSIDGGIHLPVWNSPWGPGRPGWHSECATFIKEEFGCLSNLHIHSGGKDLKFPHHENEIAQLNNSDAIAKTIWNHTGHLFVAGGEKMSKSMGNSYSIRELLDLYSSDDFRIFVLLFHYRKDVTFSHKLMKYSRNIRCDIGHWIHRTRKLLINYNGFVGDDISSSTEEESFDALYDDFQWNIVLRKIANWIREGEGMVSYFLLEKRLCFVLKFCSIVGIDVVNGDLDVLDEYKKFRSFIRKWAREKEGGFDMEVLKICDDSRERMNAMGIKIGDN